MSTRRLLVLAVLLAVGGAAVYQAVAGHSRLRSGQAASSSCPYIYLVTEDAAAHELGFNTRYGQCAPVGNKLPFTLHYSWLRCDLAGKHCLPIRSLIGQQVTLPKRPKIFTIRGAVTTTNSRGSVGDVSRDFYLVRGGIALEDRGAPQQTG